MYIFAFKLKEMFSSDQEMKFKVIKEHHIFGVNLREDRRQDND